jgi:hypothetical protein
MKTIVNLSIVLLWISNLYGQNYSESQPFLKEIFCQDRLYKEELCSQFDHFDFGPLISKNDTNILGFIGDDYLRIRIKYISIIKGPIDPTKYKVYGKSKVKSNMCNFWGDLEMIHILHIRNENKEEIVRNFLKYGDKEEAERYSKDEYILLARYKYVEDANKPGTGIFEGILRLNFYLENGVVYYNDLDIQRSDRFSNNQCVGTWTSYKNGISKRCNWGEYRIPYSGDLDIGAGYFSPDEKYFKNGWQSYSNAYVIGSKQAKIEEEKPWW